MERTIDVIDDFNGRKIVFIHDIIFKKKQYVEWKDVKEHLKKYVVEVYFIIVYGNKICAKCDKMTNIIGV